MVNAAHILLSVWNVPPSLPGHMFDEFGIDLHELSQLLEAALRENGAHELPSESLDAIGARATSRQAL